MDIVLQDISLVNEQRTRCTVRGMQVNQSKVASRLTGRLNAISGYYEVYTCANVDRSLRADNGGAANCMRQLAAEIHSYRRYRAGCLLIRLVLRPIQCF